MPDITSIAHKRDGDGNLLPVTKSVDVRGEGNFDVDVYPATTGQRNEWRDTLQDEGEELGAELEAELLDEFAALGPDDFGVDEWSDVRPAIVDALSEAIFDELFDVADGAISDALEENQAAVTEGNPT